MACSTGKTGQALQPYQGRQHDLLVDRMWNERFACGDDLAYLSARHGFVSCTTAIAPYECAMTEAVSQALIADPAQKTALAALVEGHDRVVVYGGKLYRDVVAALVGDDIEVVALLGANRGCGDHYSALSWELDGQWDC